MDEDAAKEVWNFIIDYIAKHTWSDIEEVEPDEWDKAMITDIQTNPDKYKVVNGILTDISNTDEYKDFLHQQKVQIRKSEIERQLLELDTKRIRAMCEPSIKDESTGETWLDYYNTQVAQLRKELNSL